MDSARVGAPRPGGRCGGRLEKPGGTRAALSRAGGDRVAVDVTGRSRRGRFGARDATASASHDVTIRYGGAAECAPAQPGWERVRGASLPENVDHDRVADPAAEGRWLDSGRHPHVELTRGHEGDDVAGTSALVAPLPFQAARPAAVINHAEYSRHLLIAGRPRPAENQWRLEALREFNRVVTKEWPTGVMSTLDDRAAVRELAELPFSSDPRSARRDIHGPRGGRSFRRSPVGPPRGSRAH